MAKYTKEVRCKIIDNAGGFFARYGLFKTTIDEIAQSLRMGKSSLYYHFKNKEDIFRAVLEKEADILHARIRTAISAVASPEEKLKAFAVTRIKCRQELANINSIFHDDHLHPYHFVRAIRKEHDRRELAIIKDILQEGLDTRAFAMKDVELTAQAIITALKGLEYEWSIQQGGEAVEENVDKLHHVLLHGILRK